MVWTFARLARSGYRRSEMLPAATQGFRFLADHMWDRELGGFYWEVDTTGETVTDPEKYMYGQSFALYALAEYYRASHDQAALDLATRTFDLIVQHGRDEQFGGYFEYRARDWSTPAVPHPSHIGGPVGAKLMNTHLHLLEAFAEYYRASRSARARDRLLELIAIESNSVVRKRLTACTDQYTREWTPILEGSSARVSYGHDLENIWLLADAVETAGESNHLYLDLYKSLYAYSRRFGFDDGKGGIFYNGAFRKRADKLEKVWWVQAEALVSALTMYGLTRDEAYAADFERVWSWVNTQQTDWTHGDWHNELLPDGTPRGDKASAWKEAYHQTRGLIETLSRLDALAK
jgi:mannobiose 2-epimerase